MKLKIVTPNMLGPDEFGAGHAPGTKVYLDDKELKMVCAVNVDMRVGQVNSATIEFIPTEIDIEGDFVVETTGRGEEEEQNAEK